MHQREGEGLRAVSVVALAVFAAMVLLSLLRVLGGGADGMGSSVPGDRRYDAMSSVSPRPDTMDAPGPDAGPAQPTSQTTSPVRVPSDFFTENAGQVANPEVLYYARGGVSVGFAAGAVFVNLRERPPLDELDPRSGPAPTPILSPLRGHLVRIAFEGANPVLPQARGELPHRANFFLGDDPARWRTDVRNYAEVVYENVWDGIDVVYRTSPGGVKYDLVVHPGADLADAVLAYEGVTAMTVTARSLMAPTNLGPLRDDLPAAWQVSGLPVACALRQTGERTVGYACSGWDGTGDLVIDPLLYSTFLGGSWWDETWGVAVDASGGVYVTGVTESDTDFPTTAGAYDRSHNGGNWDAFVAKLDPIGSALVYSTFLGGRAWDYGWGIAVDASGAAYVTGVTEDAAADFPTTPGAYDTTHNGGDDAFAAKLSPSGSALLYSTFLGGGGRDEGYGIAVDAVGAAYVAGFTISADFPTTPGAYSTTPNGVYDAFAAKLDASGSALLYSTFLGGSGIDWGVGIGVDALGAAYVIGNTDDAATDFPTTPGAYDTTPNGGPQDVFVAKLDATGSTLLYATFLGGSGNETGFGIAVDASGTAYLTGWTWDAATDFPTTPGAYDTTHNGGDDAFVAKLDATGSTLVYATFLGGSGYDDGIGIAVDVSGSAYVTGSTYDAATDFPTTPGAYDTTHNGGYDAFVAKLDEVGSSLLYSTFLGGSRYDDGIGIVVDASGVAFVTGSTFSTDFPTTPGAYDRTHNGGEDAFVAKLTLPLGPMPPVLSATGEPNYAMDGLDPETGTLATIYAYRVNYTDADGDPPLAVEPKVHIRMGGVEVANSPFPMTAVDPLDADVTDGKWYTYTTTLASRGTDYTYDFTATDATGLAGMDWPAPPADAPDVLNRPPTADAGPDQVGVFRGATVTLDGTASSDPDGDPLTYSWTKTAGPAVTLTDPNTANPTLTPAMAGTYAFALTVNDGMGANNTDAVIVAVVNRAPAADAGPDQNLPKGTLVTLDGALSRDPDNDVLTYSWTPASGAGWSLANPTTATPSFTPPAPGTYTFSLTVGDGFGGMATDDVVVTATNAAPIADAGPDQVGVFRGATVTLDGTASTDSDGDPLTYSWTQTSGPAVALAGANTVTPSFTPAAAGTHVFALTVDDGFGGTNVDEITVDVVNRPPTADAGPDQSGLFRNMLVAVDGTPSTDPDGDPLTYSWTQTTGPAVALTGANTATPSFTPAAAGTYTFQLTVDDGLGGTDVDEITVTVVNRAPIADAGPDQRNVTVGALVSLDGRLSSDPDGDSITFTWMSTSGPSTVTLTGPTGASPTFTPTAAGTYVFSLIVSDGTDASASDTVTIVVVEPASSPPRDTTMLIVAFLALLGVLFLLAVAATRRRKKPAEEVEGQPEEKAEGEEIRAEPGEGAADVSEPREDGGMHQ